MTGLLSGVLFAVAIACLVGLACCIAVATGAES